MTTSRIALRIPPYTLVARALLALLASGSPATAQLPLGFEPNRGQGQSSAGFLARGAGYALFLTSTDAVLHLGCAPRPSPGSVVRIKLAGANPYAPAEASGDLPGKSHYFLGNDPRRWRTNIPTFKQVRYKGVYPGVDLIYHGHQGLLEYDFVVLPGGDPGVVQLAFEGVEALQLTPRGDLIMRTHAGEIHQRKPQVYQEVNGVRRVVAGRFLLPGKRRVGFWVGPYDKVHPLVIDPVLSYATYLGGTTIEYGYAVALDSSGNAYLAGATCSSDFPVTDKAPQKSHGGGRPFGCGDAFVAKLNAQGTALVYSTYLGGGGSDSASGIAVDGTGNAYVVGLTDSPDFPTTSVAFQRSGNAFVAKLNHDGTVLMYSTRLDVGSGFFDAARSIAVDSAGSAYVTGVTHSSGFPITPGSFQKSYNGGDMDAFVAKLNAAGSELVYSTFLGGSDTDAGTDIAVDSSGNAYVLGFTFSANFPTTPGSFQTSRTGKSDEFLVKLNPAGAALVYSTYLRGRGADDVESAGAIAVDRSGNAYVAGYTSKTTIVVTRQEGFFLSDPGEGFVAKLNAAGSGLAYFIRLPGVGNDIAVDNGGNAYVVGTTGSADFPVTLGAVQSLHGGGFDAFLIKLNAAGTSPLYTTYLGGKGLDRGQAVAVDSSGSAYVIGDTDSTNFPTTQNAVQMRLRGNRRNIFVCRISNLNDPLSSPRISANGVANGASFSAEAVAPSSIISVFGTDLAPTTLKATGTPLPTILAGTSVSINGRSAPLFFVSPSQINAQLPFETAPGAAMAVVSVGGLASSPATFSVRAAAPGIFQYGANRCVVQNQDGSLNGPDSPAAARSVMVAYLTGQGQVDNVVATGAPARSDPLSRAVAPASATIGAQTADLLFLGLTPGFAGLAQANIRVPVVPAGDHQLQLTVGGVPSNRCLITVSAE